MPRHRAVLHMSSIIAVLIGLSAVRSSLAGVPTSPLTTTTPVVPISPQRFMPLVLMIPAPTPTSTPIPTATATAVPAPPTATPIVPTATLPAVTPFCAGVPDANAPNSPIAITTVNKSGNPETVTIRNVSAGTIDLSGWWICSMLGHQLHGILSGTIAPGQTIVIPSQAGGPIWNNTTTDPAALYRRDGVQIGYRSQ